MKKILHLVFCLCVLLACSEDNEPLVVTSIALDKDLLELKVGESYQFKVSHMPSEAPSPDYIWHVSKIAGTQYEGATINEEGEIKALKDGRVTVTVETTDVSDLSTGEPFRATCEVTIKPVEAEGITLDKTELTLDPEKTDVLVCSFQPENTTHKEVEWKSSNPDVVTITANNSTPFKGEIKAVSSGEATITVSVKKNPIIAATCKIKVNAAKIEGFELQEKEKTVLQGESFKLTPLFTPAYATNKKLEWNSSDETIATVDQDGNVTTHRFGQCTITAISEDGGFKATCQVIVKPIPVESIQFPEVIYTVEIGGEKQLSVVVMPENAGNKKVMWRSSRPIVASIDENGIVKGNTSGNITITATTEDGGHIASCTVYVVEIDRMMNVYFPSSSVMIINGFYTGNVACGIRNNSSRSVKLTRFRVIDTNNFQTVAETTDPSLLGTVLAPGEAVALSGRFNSVYEPAFIWEFEYNGRTFSTYNKYGDYSDLSSEVRSVEKSKVQVPLRRIE